MDAVIEYAMRTPEGDWRVEVVKRGRTRWYRITHQDNEVDWLSIAAVQRILSEAGIDMADLIEAADTADAAESTATAEPPPSVDDSRPGAA